jgi:hypothetical protein
VCAVVASLHYCTEYMHAQVQIYDAIVLVDAASTAASATIFAIVSQQQCDVGTLSLVSVCTHAERY